MEDSPNLTLYLKSQLRSSHDELNDQETTLPTLLFV